MITLTVDERAKCKIMEVWRLEEKPKNPLRRIVLVDFGESQELRYLCVCEGYEEAFYRDDHSYVEYYTHCDPIPKITLEQKVMQFLKDNPVFMVSRKDMSAILYNPVLTKDHRKRLVINGLDLNRYKWSADGEKWHEFNFEEKV